MKGLVLFVGKRTKTWYFQKDVGGQTRRILIGRYPVISAHARRVLADWRADYNAVRPHTSLGGLTPIEYANRARKAQNENIANL